MPKRTDISSILVIGAGPIVIGQACEFDYSGTQAIKALKEEGYRIVLVNSNPATIMTDPELADATYVEPITPAIVAKIIEKERPDAILPTMGGQTALNTALALFHDGTLEKFGVTMIGADADAIDMAEDRLKFRDAMDRIGLESARSAIAHTVVKLGRMIDGSPVFSSPSSASSTVCAITERALSRPIRSIASRNFSRSSAMSIASASAPIIVTPNFSSVPSWNSASAVFSAVWPPIVGRIASGRSFSMILATTAGVIGST